MLNYSRSRSSSALLARLSRSVVYTFACLAIVIPTSGCFGLKVRELRTQNQMKEARILQLEQDLTALRDENSGLRENLSSTSGSLKTTTDKANAAKLALSETTESRSRELAKNLTTSIESEAKLKAQVEQLEAKNSALETQLIDLRDSLKDSQTLANQKADEATKYRTVTTQTQTTIDEAKRQLADLSAKADAKAKEAADASTKLDALNSQYRQASDELDQTKKKLAEAETETASLKDKIAALPAPKLSASPETVASAEELIRKQLANSVTTNKVRVTPEPGSVRVILFSDDLFQLGKLEFSEGGASTITALAQAIKATSPKRVIVQGHTDDVPVKNMSYQDNWELASERANEVIRKLILQDAADAGKFVSESHAYYAPISNAKDTAARKQNRRVEVIFEL